jgi:hypothetical protein
VGLTVAVQHRRGGGKGATRRRFHDDDGFWWAMMGGLGPCILIGGGGGDLRAETEGRRKSAHGGGCHWEQGEAAVLRLISIGFR